MKSIKLLKEIINQQKLTSKSLEVATKSSRKKYSQARITVEQLITEQERFLQSKLDEIDSKLEIVTTLLNYFKVFTETPCEINTTL